MKKSVDNSKKARPERDQLGAVVGRWLSGRHKRLDKRSEEGAVPSDSDGTRAEKELGPVKQCSGDCDHRSVVNLMAQSGTEPQSDEQIHANPT